MTQLASDSFARANENPLTDGGFWTTITGMHPPQVVSDVCEGSSLGNINGSYWSELSWPNDQYSEIQLQTINQANGAWLAVLARIQSSAESGYYFELDGIGSNQNIAIGTLTNGTRAHFATGTLTAAQGGVFRIEAQGTTIRGLYNGTQVLSFTDSTYGSGSAGFLLTPQSSLSDVQISNWDGGDFSSGGGSGGGGTPPDVFDPNHVQTPTYRHPIARRYVDQRPSPLKPWYRPR